MQIFIGMEYHRDNGTQRTKINNCFSNSSEIEFSVPQVSILGFLFFTINLVAWYNLTCFLISVNTLTMRTILMTLHVTFFLDI